MAKAKEARAKAKTKNPLGLAPDDPAVRTGTPDGFEIDAGLLGEPSGEG